MIVMCIFISFTILHSRLYILYNRRSTNEPLSGCIASVWRKWNRCQGCRVTQIYIYRSPGRIAIRMCEQQTESQMTKKYEWTKSRAFFYYLCLFVIGDGVVCRLVASSSLAPLNLCVSIVLCRVNGKKNESDKKVNDQWLSIRSLIKSSQMCVDRWLSISPLPIEYYNIEIENAQQYKESKTNRYEEWKWIKITCYSYSYSSYMLEIV